MYLGQFQHVPDELVAHPVEHGVHDGEALLLLVDEEVAGEEAHLLAGDHLRHRLAGLLGLSLHEDVRDGV